MNRVNFILSGLATVRKRGKNQEDRERTFDGDIKIVQLQQSIAKSFTMRLTQGGLEDKADNPTVTV